MSLKKREREYDEKPGDKEYFDALYLLQVELVKLQKHFIACQDKILIILEGRDAAGKDGLIKRFVEHLSPRETRIVALGKPSDRDLGAWYFQRYVPHLPVAQELILFNRSWYNRAGVERVMGFCTAAQCEEFLLSVPRFEQMLADSGIRLFKFYLDISKVEQARRLRERSKDPLKQWKVSPIDQQAQARWKAYSSARDEMLRRTHTETAPWIMVRADDKKAARLNVIRYVLSHLEYRGKDKKLGLADPKVVFAFSPACIENGSLAK
jgi:polyphosphate kinase 2